MPEREPVFTMAIAAQLTRMHPQTLRKYERAGLISPSRSSGSQRLYSEADVGRLRRIHHLVDERGLNIAGLALAFAMLDRLDAVDPDAGPAELRIAIDEARGSASREKNGNDPPT